MKERSRFSTRMLAVFLSMAILLTTVLPNITLSAAAETQSASTVSTSDGLTVIPAEELVTTADDIFVLRELTDRREANVKHFLMSDGSKVAALYSDAIHYEKDGVWKEIDNDVVYNAESRCYENAANRFVARFADGSTPQVSVTEGDYTISLTYIPQNSTGAEVMSANAAATATTPTVTRRASLTETAEDEPTDDVSTAMRVESSRSGKIRYDVNATTDGVSIEYLPTASGVKENIILSRRDTANSFAFDVTAPGLTLEQQEDGSILAQDGDGEIVFAIPAPYMFDGAGEISYNVAYVLEQTGGSWQITVVADKTWLNDAARTYPVTIDPAIITDRSTRAADTCFISTADEDYSYGGNHVEIGRYLVGGTPVKSRAYINVSPVKLDASSTIVSAKLNLCYQGCNGDAYIQLSLYEVLSDFTGVTWETKDDLEYSEKPCDYLVVGSNTWVYHEYDVTESVQGWIMNPASQHGFMIMSDIEDTDTFKYVNYTTENSSTNYPVMVIDYRDTKGIESYWTYTSMSAGNGGAVGVNNYNGNAVGTIPLVGLSGLVMPVSVSMTYDAARYNTFSGASKIAFGWRLNYDWQICPADLSLQELGYQYYLIDGDGTEHYFYNADPDTATSWEDEDGLGYTLTEIKTGSKVTGYTIVDKSKAEMLFNADGFLTTIYDTNSTVTAEKNKITITRETDNRISKITDGAGREYTFAYATYGGGYYLSSVTDPVGNRVSLATQTSGSLTALTYKHSTDVTQCTTEFAYSGGRLATVDNVDGTTTGIRYTADGNKVAALYLLDRNGDEAYTYTFAYRYCETDITDKFSRTVTYQFNTFGQTTGVIDRTSGMAQYYSYAGGNSTAADAGVNKNANKLLQSSNVQQPVINRMTNGGLDTNSGFALTGTYVYVKNYNDMSYGHTGVGSYKLLSAATASQTVTGLTPNTWYTASAYVNTYSSAYTDTAAKLTVSGFDAAGTTEYSAPIHKTNGEWQRVFVTFKTGDSTSATVTARVDGTSSRYAFFDDFQLEEGQAVNSYNLLAHTHAMENWTAVSGTTSATYNYSDLRVRSVTGTPASQAAVYSADISVMGKAGDILSFGCWASANSVATDGRDRNLSSSITAAPTFRVELRFYNGTTLVDESTATIDFNANVAGNQFIAAPAVATADYTKVRLYLRYDYNVGTAYFAMPYIYKENFGGSYTYDGDGNLVSAVDNAETTSTFAYSSDKLGAMTTPTGSAFFYSYKNGTRLIDEATSSSGQTYSYTYDVNGNILTSTVSASKYETALTSGKTYLFRNLYSGNALGSVASDMTAVKNRSYDGSSYQRYTLVAVDDSAGIYQIRSPYSAYSNYYLTTTLVDGNYALTMSSSPTEANSYFKFTQNADGSFTILCKAGGSDYTSCLDGQPGDRTSADDGTPVYAEAVSETRNVGQHWFVYDASYAYTGSTIGTSATYDATGNRLMTSTDAAGNTVSYTYNDDGTVHTVTDPKGNTTTYGYDALGRVVSVTGGDLSVAYGYDPTYLTDLTAIRRNGAASGYTFTYNALGQTATIAAVGQTLASYSYDDYDRLSRLAYGGGGADNVLYAYDDLDRIVMTMYTNSAMMPVARYYYVYDATGRLFSVTDDEDRATYYIYDLVGRLCEIQCTEGTGAEKVLASRLNYAYDEQNRLTGYTVSGKGISAYTATATYGDAAKGENPDAVYAWNTGNSKLDYVYDDLGRAVSRTLTTYGDVPVTTQYEYKDGAGENTTTTMVEGLTNGIYGEYTYFYDANGNIRSIMDYTTGVALSIHYTYDAHNQLIREDSQVENKTHTWEYDSQGNILSKKTYAYTREETLGTPESVNSYTYYNAVPDILINYNGQYFNYDSIGNPTSYRGMTMTWTQGRRLATLSKDGLTASYTYDVNGIRTSKTINGVTTEYMVLDGVVLGVLVPNSYRLVFLRNSAGTIYGFKYYKYTTSTNTYNYNQTYYYETNVQGDIVAIYNAAGTLTATYKYDAWGKLLGVYNASGTAITSSTSIGIINPIRYRGYIYDTETGFYYLQSRYYDPEVGRFLNTDAYVSTGTGFIGYNMYAYCSNNPILYCDTTGFTQTVVNPVTGELVVIPDGGLPSSAELAAVDVCFKTDMNDDNAFDYNDINRIISYYNADRNDVFNILKMLRPVDTIVDSSKNDSSKNNTIYSHYSPRAPSYSGGNQQAFGMSEEQITICVEVGLQITAYVAPKIASNCTDSVTRSTFIKIAAASKVGGVVLFAYECLDAFGVFDYLIERCTE